MADFETERARASGAEGDRVYCREGGFCVSAWMLKVVRTSFEPNLREAKCERQNGKIRAHGCLSVGEIPDTRADKNAG